MASTVGGVNDVARPQKTSAGRAIALRDPDVHAVVAGTIDRVGIRYAITARVIDPQSGIVATSRREDATNAAEVATAIHRLSDWIRATVGEPRASITSTDGLPSAAAPSLKALRLLSEAQAAAQHEHWAEADTLLTSALATDPQFAAAQMWLALAQQNQGKPQGAPRSPENQSIPSSAGGEDFARTDLAGGLRPDVSGLEPQRFGHLRLMHIGADEGERL